MEDFFRDWVYSARCPWYIQEQYYDDNRATFRQARSAGTQGARRPGASSAAAAADPEAARTEAVAEAEAAWDNKSYHCISEPADPEAARAEAADEAEAAWDYHLS